MAIEICTTCAPILQRRAIQYFSDILLSVSNASGTEELEELKKAHELIIKVNAVVPDLLLNVLPLVQEEMKLDQANVRQMATETMGKLFAHPDTNVSEKYPSIWKTWLGRRDDKLAQLRVKWLEMCVDVYKNHVDLATDIIGKLRYFENDKYFNFLY
jgi:sister-chromatid-cohesion protein PDS5